MTGSPRLTATTAPALLWLATALTLVTGLACALVAGLTSGGRAVLSAAAAVAVVLGFLWFGQLPIALAARGHQRLATVQLIVGCILRVAVGVLALRLFLTSPTFDRRVFGLSVVFCALAWTAGAVWTFARWRSVTIEPDMSGRS